MNLTKKMIMENLRYNTNAGAFSYRMECTDNIVFNAWCNFISIFNKEYEQETPIFNDNKYACFTSVVCGIGSNCEWCTSSEFNLENISILLNGINNCELFNDCEFVEFLQFLKNFLEQDKETINKYLEVSMSKKKTNSIVEVENNVKNNSTNMVEVTQVTQEQGKTMEQGTEQDEEIYSICEKIMEAQEQVTFKPFHNKNNVVKIEKFASHITTGYNEKLLKDCRSINRAKCENSIKIIALSKYFETMSRLNKFSNGCEFSTKKLNNMFIAWNDGKFTFNLKDKNDLRLIAQSVAYSNLLGYCPQGKMFVILTNSDGCDIIRLVDYVENFYTWKQDKKAQEQEQDKFNLSNLINVASENLNSVSLGEFDNLLNELLLLRNKKAQELKQGNLFIGKLNK